jgi:hypothetical protein
MPSISTFSFAVQINNYDEWEPDFAEQAEDGDTDSYEDYATQELERVMHDAGSEFVKANPTVFGSHIACSDGALSLPEND